MAWRDKIGSMRFEEFEQLPDMPGKQELIDGLLCATPPAEITHSQVRKHLFVSLSRTLGQERVWSGLGYRIGGDWIEPDVSVTWPDQGRDDKYFLRAPQLAVEVLSPGETVTRKLELYFEAGCQEVWIVDPRKQTFAVCTKTGEQVMHQEISDSFCSEVAAAIISREDIFPA